MPRHTSNPFLGSRFRDAFLFAASLHETQVRKKTSAGKHSEQDVPYLSHLMAVSALVVESGGNEDEAIAALLHDALEDGPDCLLRRKTSCLELEKQKIPEELQKLQIEIRETIITRFGKTVCAIVEACSEDKSISEKSVRKRLYLDALKTASDSARLVMICDKIHNAESIALDLSRFGESVWTKFSLGKDASRNFYSHALQCFRSQNSDDRLFPLVVRFERVVDVLNQS